LQNVRVVNYVNAKTPGSGREWAAHWLVDGLSALEAMLTKSYTGKFAVGDTITIADLCIPSIVYNAKRFVCFLAASLYQ
uniref:GST C-terminal domain-containing protein n=1 Tax=Heligmosomoides polygyrus TaxID=6339 RepID=A0A183GWL7_HELPZ